MTEASLTPATFTPERTYPVAARKLFAALADPEARERWGAPSADQALTFELFQSSQGTRLNATGQLASIDGEGMIPGNQNGVSAALRNLEQELQGVSE